MPTYHTECTFHSESTDSISTSSNEFDSNYDSSPLYPHQDRSDVDEVYHIYYDQRQRMKKHSSRCSLFDRSLLKGAAVVREHLLSKEPLLQTNNHGDIQEQDNKHCVIDPIEMKKSRSLVKRILNSPKSIIIPADETENAFHGYGKMSDSMRPSSYASKIHKLHEEEAYLHACRAGKAWQSLIGQFIRFPEKWDFQDMFSDSQKLNEWKYISRSQIRASKVLNEIVPTPCAPGRLLLHISVKDLSSSEISQEFVIGVSHPRLITEKRKMIDYETRLVWMAVREKSVGDDDYGDRKTMSLLRPLLGKGYEDGGKVSPLGSSRSLVGNHNIRTVS